MSRSMVGTGDTRRRRGRRAAALRGAALVAVTSCAVAACGDDANDGGPGADVVAAPSGQTTAPVVPGTAAPSPRPLGPDDWPTYHRDNARHGDAPRLAPLSTLSVGWHAKLDGAVYGQPLVVGGSVLVATENDTVYALDAGTGKVTWSAHVGQPVALSKLPCGNIDPLGITGTMVYDPVTGRVFAVAETTGGHHQLVGIDVRTGTVASRVTVDPPKGDPVAHQERGALTLVGDRVYVPYGGLAGDCAHYIGSVVSAPTGGGTDLRSYAIPTTREAGIWAPSGGTVDGDRLLYADGNGESTHGYDGSDSVIALSTGLARTDLFAPSTWPDDNRTDLDLGSMGPVLVGNHVLTIGKRGVAYVLRRDHFGGIGGQVTQKHLCRAFGGAAVVGDTVYVPCADGPRAISVASDGTITQRWKAPVGAAGSPVVGGGAVWAVDYDGGVLYALDPGSGTVRQKVTIGTAPHFASPTLSGNRAYVGVLDGVVAVNGA